MVKISLTPEEARSFREIIEYTLSELRMEIAGTESYDWRQKLHKQAVSPERGFDHYLYKPQYQQGKRAGFLKLQPKFWCSLLNNESQMTHPVTHFRRLRDLPRALLAASVHLIQTEMHNHR